MSQHLPFRLALLCMLCLCGTSRAAETHWCGLVRAHPVDAAFALALERSGGVTVDIRDAQASAYAGWDAELNRLYRLLMKRLGSGAAADALRQAQRAWLAWDDAELASDTALAGDGGSAGPITVADQAIARRRARACTFQNLLAGEG